MSDVPWRSRLHHGLIYVALVVLLLTPYLMYLSVNRGILFQLQTATSWSQRDRARAPLVWPTFTSDTGVDDSASSRPSTRIARLLVANQEASIFYLFVVLPFACLALLYLAPGAFRPDWRFGREKVAIVAILAIMLNAGFLRGNLSARLADVSVPQVILIAWLLMTGLSVARTGTWDGKVAVSKTIRALVPAAAVLSLLIVGLMLALAQRDRDVLLSLEQTRWVINRFWSTWPLDESSRFQPGPARVASYLQECTRAGDHVFVTPYLPQVVGLSGRPFAGGHGDLRPDFYNTDTHQGLTIERLQRQSVPIVIMPREEEREGFRRSFPILDEYLRTRFQEAGSLDLGDDQKLQLLVDRGRPASGRFEPFGWPCFD
jgi:hypothetical protein